MNLNKLPYELQIDILLRAGYPDLLKYCEYSKYDICDDEYLWSELMKKDFPNLYKLKLRYSNYKEVYLRIYNYLYETVQSMLEDLADNIPGITFYFDEDSILELIQLFIRFGKKYQKVDKEERNELLYELGDIINYTKTNRNDPNFRDELDILDRYISDILVHLRINYFKRVAGIANKCGIGKCKSIRIDRYITARAPVYPVELRYNIKNQKFYRCGVSRIL